MYQFTTPTIRIIIPDALPVGNITSLVVTLLQGKVRLEKDLSAVQLDTENNVISFTLSQEETGSFSPNNIVAVQCHILVGGTAYATDIMGATIGRNIHNEVIT